MDRNDQQAIEQLFDKLNQVEAQATPRDGDADAFIQKKLTEQPGAAYYMAQTIVVQEQALEQAQARIEALEAQGQRSSGGLLGGLFGGQSAPARTAVPQAGQRSGLSSGGRFSQAGSGGFLAGAAQTAMGVAGGVLLANAIGGLFAPDAAQAGEAGADAEQPMEDPGVDDGGFDAGGDFGDVGF